MSNSKKINAVKAILAMLILIGIAAPSDLFAQAKVPAKKVAPAKKIAVPGKKAAEVKEEAAVDKEAPVSFKSKFLPSIEMNIPISIPISGISDLYTIGFGVNLAFTIDKKFIPYTNIGLQTGYQTFSSDLDGFKSGFSFIPFIPYLEPCYNTEVGQNFLLRPFGKFGMGAAYAMGSDSSPVKSASYSSVDMAIMLSVGTGISHKEFPEWLEILFSIDYLMLMEKESASMLNINLGVKYRFYTRADNMNANTVKQ